VKNQDTWFIKFYSPNCGFCTGVEEVWDNFHDETEKDQLDWKVAKINVLNIKGKDDPRASGVLPGPLPGLHLFPPNSKTFYEYPSPRSTVTVAQLMEFALFGYEDKTPAWKELKDFFASHDALALVDEKSWDELTVNDGEYIVMVYGPKCGWCKGFLPIYEEFAKLIPEKGYTMKPYWINGSNAWKFGDRYHTRPWPSFIYWKNGHYYRMDTDDVRDIKNVQQLIDWFDTEAYLELDDEHQGVDPEVAKIRKLLEAKEKSRKQKEEKAKQSEEL